MQRSGRSSHMYFVLQCILCIHVLKSSKSCFYAEGSRITKVCALELDIHEHACIDLHIHLWHRSVRVAERLALPTSDHGVAGSNPAGGKILPEPKRRFIAQSLSCSPFHRLEMTEILLKGRKTLNSSIHPLNNWAATWENQQNELCAQRRLRSAWASAQSD